MIFEHGGDTYNNEILYDFSANINPLGMPEGVKNALVASVGDWGKYPDPYCRRLTEKIAESTNFKKENIVCGNGAADLIYRIIQTIRPKRSVISAPTFSEYEKALRESDSEVIRYELSENNGFILDEGILDILDENTDMLILCSPNNPTGRTVIPDLLEKICRKCLEEKIIFLCDECFMDFVRDGKSLSAKNFLNKNIIILKAFTKTFAMAGLRLGYAVFGDTGLAEAVRKTGQFWSVSVPAQIAGIAALDEKDHVSKAIDIIEKEREYLQNKLSGYNFKAYPSEVNFILFRCDFPLDEMLLKEKIMIRSCENFNCLGKNYFRIAVRSHDENIILTDAMERILNVLHC